MSETTWLEVVIPCDLYEEFRRLLVQKAAARGEYVEDTYDISESEMRGPVAEALRLWMSEERTALISKAQETIRTNASKMKKDTEVLKGLGGGAYARPDGIIVLPSPRDSPAE